jgi:N-acetylglucosamine-6-phosphate deacetylase
VNASSPTLATWIMSQLLLNNARVILEDRIERGSVLVSGGRIARVFIDSDAPSGLSAAESVDLRQSYLAPGLIDIHIHGSAGVDVLEADACGLASMSEFLLREGLTGYFATLVPTDDRGYLSALAEIESFVGHQDGSARSARARILGLHFEGPFVNENKCGALQTRHFRKYDGDARALEIFTGGNLPAQSLTRLMTLAPEIAGGLDLTRELTAKGVRAFLGHSQADPEVLDRAVEAGARHITHFPNALEPMHHRKPGAVAWGLVSDQVTIDCIADFHHVHPLMLRLIYQSKSASRMALISDAILPTGMGDGEFTVWGDRVSVKGGRTALVEGPARGAIAGSVITMRQAVKNMLSLGAPLHEVIRMASLVPARAAGIEAECGSIEQGKRADLVVFDDEIDVRLAVVGGAVVFDEK